MAAFQSWNLWITRDNLWISDFRCGEVQDGLKIPINTHPHIWTMIFGVSKMWIG